MAACGCSLSKEVPCSKERPLGQRGASVRAAASRSERGAALRSPGSCKNTSGPAVSRGTTRGGDFTLAGPFQQAVSLETNVILRGAALELLFVSSASSLSLEHLM